MSAFADHLLTIILFTPLAGAIAILLLRRERTNAVRWMANGFAAAGFLAAVPLWFLYDPHGKTWQFAERGRWLPSIGASYYVGVDGFSILLILLTTLIGWIAVLASWEDIRERVKEFYVCLLVLQTGMLGVFMALDFLLFLLFWEAMLLPMYFLIGIWGGGQRRYSATKFLIYTLAGTIVTLAGVLTLSFYNHSVTNSYSFDVTQYHTLNLPFAVQTWVFLAFFLGFAITVPLFPFHRWLPGVHTDAPTAGSIILAAVFLKVGAYGFIRFSLPILPDASRYFAPMMVALALIGIVYGAVAALAQTDWKRLIAYASFSHMGLIVLGAFALTPVAVTGSIVQQINHGISTAALFLIVGAACRRRQTGDISAFGGLRRVMPVFAAVFLIMTLSVIGVPALNGFVGQRLILRGVYAVNKAWAVLAAFGLVLGAVYLLRLFRRTMLGRLDNPANAALRDLTGREAATLVPLVALAIWIGVYPAPLLRRLETAVGRVVVRIDPAYAPHVAQGSDCPTPAAPDPSGPPPSFVLVEPCADGSDATKKKPPEAGATVR